MRLYLNGGKSMNYKYALLNRDTGGKTDIVQTVIVCENVIEANRLAQAIYGENASAVEAERYSFEAGDVMKNNVPCYTGADGTLIEREYVPSEAEKVSKLNATVAELQSANAELMLVVSDIIGGEEDAK